MTMKWKIGEIFEYNGEWLQCIIANRGCYGCAFSNPGSYCTHHSECMARERSDSKSVIFKKLEKVGEPILYGLRLTQRYKVSTPVEMPKDPSAPCISYNFIDNLLYIEIKQNKETMEDMEEKKLNLKPFDLQKAKQGKPVCTRDGRKARIICFDAEGNKPLIVLSKINGQEVILRYTKKGQSDNFHSPTPREDDLMMLPEKKEGWVNVYKECDGERVERFVYKTEKEAFDNAGPDNYIATVKIEWEE